MQCSVFFTISFTFLFTWVFIQLMAFSGPINLYIFLSHIQTEPYKTKPYKNPSIHSFASHLTTDGTTWQRQKLIKLFTQVFLSMPYKSLVMVNYCRKLIVLVFFFWCIFQITVSSFWCPNVHVVHKYIAKVSNPLY